MLELQACTILSSSNMDTEISEGTQQSRWPSHTKVGLPQLSGGMRRTAGLPFQEERVSLCSGPQLGCWFVLPPCFELSLQPSGLQIGISPLALMGLRHLNLDENYLIRFPAACWLMTWALVPLHNYGSQFLRRKILSMRVIDSVSQKDP